MAGIGDEALIVWMVISTGITVCMYLEIAHSLGCLSAKLTVQCGSQTHCCGSCQADD
jgi:hypothetical protein